MKVLAETHHTHYISYLRFINGLYP